MIQTHLFSSSNLIQRRSSSREDEDTSTITTATIKNKNKKTKSYRRVPSMTKELPSPQGGELLGLDENHSPQVQEDGPIDSSWTWPDNHRNTRSSSSSSSSLSFSSLTSPSQSPLTAANVWSVSLFSITTILLFADQNLMSPNLTAIAHEFGFSDNERDAKLGGEIAFAFFCLGAPASYIIGCLGDAWNRSILFALTVGLGEGACLATAFCQTYPQLFVSRAVTGLALGGALPLIYSILGDLFVARHRHLVGAVVGMGTGVGIMLGQAVAGFVGPTYGWRLPFALISVPALVCALLVLWTVKDPPRGQMEEAALSLQQPQRRHNGRRQTLHEADHNEDSPFVDEETTVRTEDDDEEEYNAEDGVEMARISSMSNHYSDKLERREYTDTKDDQPHGHVYYHHTGSDGDEAPHNGSNRLATNRHDYWLTFRTLLATPTVVLCLLQGAPGCVPWGIINTYLNDFLSEEKGMTIEAATTVAMVFGLGNFFGLMLGGAGGSYLYTKDIRWPAILAGGTAMAGCLPFWFLINLNMDFKSDSRSSIFVAYAGAILLGFLAGATGPIVRATLQNVTLPQARGQAFALFNTFDDFGRGLGPAFVSGLIRLLGGRQPAFNVGVWGWALCGILNLLIFFNVARDERHIQAMVHVQLTGQSSR